MVHAGCDFVTHIHPSKTWTSGSFVSVRWNACVHTLDLSLYSHPKKFLGNGVRTHVKSKGKIPSIGTFLLREGLNLRRCTKQDSEPNTLPTSYSDPTHWDHYFSPTDWHGSTEQQSLRWHTCCMWSASQVWHEIEKWRCPGHFSGFIRDTSQWLGNCKKSQIAPLNVIMIIIIISCCCDGCLTPTPQSQPKQQGGRLKQLLSSQVAVIVQRLNKQQLWQRFGPSPCVPARQDCTLHKGQCYLIIHVLLITLPSFLFVCCCSSYDGCFPRQPAFMETSLLHLWRQCKQHRPAMTCVKQLGVHGSQISYRPPFTKFHGFSILLAGQEFSILWSTCILWLIEDATGEIIHYLKTTNVDTVHLLERT